MVKIETDEARMDFIILTERLGITQIFEWNDDEHTYKEVERQR